MSYTIHCFLQIFQILKTGNEKPTGGKTKWYDHFLQNGGTTRSTFLQRIVQLCV